MVVFKNTTGPNNPNSKLTREQVLEVRRLYAEGMETKDIAKIYGITRASAYQVATRRRYASIK